ncbi:MAG TPA: hypothetical protein ENK14_11890 [Caldithrix sp.]|nr:hypothetical protein [Caldithrix sp.]
MEFVFNIPQFADIDDALSREWIETDQLGNYASSTILGLNTRKEHGLFVAKREDVPFPFILLSHLQEEIHNEDKICSLFNEEYESKTLLEGAASQVKFRLDPYPTFTYQCGNLTLEKSIFLVREQSRMVLSYHITGERSEDCRLIVRPFFAFRSMKEVCNPAVFLNQEVFIIENHFRFLPYPEAPEVFMFHSAGQFISASMWYHNFKYRKETDQALVKEDLLNPGFFEIPLNGESTIYLSLGYRETSLEEIREWQRAEEFNRVELQESGENRDKLSKMYQKRLNNFSYKFNQKNTFFLGNLPLGKVHLFQHIFVIQKLIKGGVGENEARRFYRSIRYLFKSGELLKILSGEHPQFTVNNLVPCRIILFLYNYHNIYDRQKTLPKSLDMIHEIIQLIQKNRLPFYHLNKHQFLETITQEPDSKNVMKYEILAPEDPSFVMNLFWYNAIKIASQLSTLISARNSRFEKIAQKIHEQFTEKFAPIFPESGITDSSYPFHPSMIVALTLPFGILNRSQSKKLFKILVQKFLTSKGVKYPLNISGKTVYTIAPLLIGDYLEAWQNVMTENERFYVVFHKLARSWDSTLHQGMLGYLPEMLISSPADDFSLQSSALSTSEALYLLKKMETLREKYQHVSPLPEN